MFPWPNFFPIKKYSLTYAWHVALCKIIFRSHFPFDSPKEGGQISILSPLRRWGNWLTVTCLNETKKWDKLVVDLGPDHRGLKCEAHDTWSDKSALDPVPTTSQLNDPRLNYLTSLSLSNLISKIGIKMLILPTSQGLWGLNNTS